MRGSIRERGKNTWQIQIYTGVGPDGKRRRHYETIRGRKADAQRKLTELLASLDKGAYIPPGKLTLAEHLRNWLEGYVKNNCAIRTVESYRSIVEVHLIPNLGQHQLKDLNYQAISKYYAKAGERLSARTIHHQHRVLSEALRYAVKKGLLARNPCDLADVPSPKGKTMRTLTQSEVTDLLISAESSQHYPVIYTALRTGLRQAELLGLRWRDIKFDSRTISVNRALYKRRGVVQFIEPKTNRSRRTVSISPNLMRFLGQYRLDRERLYREITKTISQDDLVFANHQGEPIDPGVLSHNFARVAKRAGLENVRFHDLRHTFASLMLQRGVAPKVISEALGHSSVAFTMDVYSHIIPGMQSEAMKMLDEVLPDPKNEVSETITAI